MTFAARHVTRSPAFTTITTGGATVGWLLGLDPFPRTRQWQLVGHQGSGVDNRKFLGDACHGVTDLFGAVIGRDEKPQPRRLLFHCGM